MQTQFLKHSFRVACELFQFFVRVARMRELDQFDLLELVLADDAANILPIRSGLAAKAWRIGGKTQGQTCSLERLVAVEIRDRNFGGRNQPEIFFSVRHAERI